MTDNAMRPLQSSTSTVDAWFEPCIRPPSSSVYYSEYSNRSSEGNQNRECAYSSKLGRLMKDPLSRRLISIISPIQAMPLAHHQHYQQALSNMDKGDTMKPPSECPCPSSSSSSHSKPPMSYSSVLSPFPHPSFPHRERPIPVYNYNTCTDSHTKTTHNNYDSQIRYFFYPRQPYKEQLQLQQEQRNVHNIINNSSSFYNQKLSNDIILSSSLQQEQHEHPKHFQHINNKLQHNDKKDKQRGLQYYHHDHNNDLSRYDNRVSLLFNHNSSDHVGQSQKVQSHLIRNHENGVIGTTSTMNMNHATTAQHTIHQDWEQIGQITSYRQGIQYDDVHNNDCNTKTNDCTSKRKRGEQKKRKKKRNKQNHHHHGSDKDNYDIDNQDIRKLMVPRQSDTNTDENCLNSNDHNINNENEDKNFYNRNNLNSRETTGRQFTKSKRRKGTIETSSNPNRKPQFITSIPYETLRDFVEAYDVKNAGSSSESLREFLRIIKSKKYIAWTMIFQDVLCTTPLLPSSKKYCTEKGPECVMWNCSCDNQIRAMQASAPLMGAMFVFPMDSSDGKSNHDDPDLETFILPLAPTSDPEDGSTKDIDSGYERMAQWPFLPIACDTNLEQRWDTLRAILTDKHLKCITFNAQVALMPFHFHSANDIQQSDNSNSNKNFGYMDLVLPNIWDLRLASWMLAPHTNEIELELQKKIDGFRHLLPKDHFTTSVHVSKQFNGLLEAKNNLAFLYIIYPVIEKLLDDNGLKTAFEEIESPLQSVLSAMECLGVGFKPSRLLQIETSVESRIKDLISESQRLANDNAFSLSSPQQVASLLYDKMGIGLSDNVSRSTSEDTLKLIQQQARSRSNQEYRIIDILLEFRGLNKMLNTYIKPYQKLARENLSKKNNLQGMYNRRSKKGCSESTKMIYPMWIQTAVRTGRLSCRKPNMQQIPTDTIMGVCPRNAFTASSKESCLFACDYSQNEVRILAHMTGDPNLISLFIQPGNSDIYKQMSAVITGKSLDSVSKQERAIAKQVTLAIIYGMGLNSVATKLSISKSMAQNFFQSFYGRFPKVKVWMNTVKDFAKKHKYVMTITGRKR